MSDSTVTPARVAELSLLIFVVLIVAGQFIGQPVFIAFVETGSMAPELEPGDGFIAVPAPLAGSFEEGDVVTFQSKSVQGGGLTTHRITGENDVGYITKGDANPFTDQADGEPPVQRPQIVAEALQIGDTVVVLPQLGTGVLAVRQAITEIQRTLSGLLGTRALLGTEGFGYLLLAGTILYYVGSVFFGSKKDESRTRSSPERNAGIDPQIVAISLVILLLCGATAAMVVPSGTQEYNLLSSDSTSERSYVVPVGESKTYPYTVENKGLISTIVYLDTTSDGTEIRPRELLVDARTTSEATVRFHAPERTGVFNRYVTEHRYLAILPTPVIHSLYTVHPWLPIVVIDALIGIPFYLFGITLLGKGRIRERSKNRELPLATRIRRLLRTR